MVDIVFDMETGDPDDFLTLIFLLGHPQVNLKAVTITPGTPHQCGIVRWALKRFDVDIPVGAYNLEHVKYRGTDQERYVTCVSQWHYKFLGDVSPATDKIRSGMWTLYKNLDENTTLLTGAPLKNLGALLDFAEDRSYVNLKFPLVSQGGFAGVNVVPEELVLEKFAGMVTCPTYNLNGDPKSAIKALNSEMISSRKFVSKNVCHGVYYDKEMHKRVAERINQLSGIHRHRLSLEIIYQGMGLYLKKNSNGKKFHDPLAACCAINSDIGTWEEVKLYRHKGQWGSNIQPGTNTHIIVDYDREKFIETLLGY